MLAPVVPPTSQINVCYRHTGLNIRITFYFLPKSRNGSTGRPNISQKTSLLCAFNLSSRVLTARKSSKGILFMSKLPLPTKLEAFKPMIWGRSLSSALLLSNLTLINWSKLLELFLPPACVKFSKQEYLLFQVFKRLIIGLKGI